jgi:hypothetical protein
MNTAGGTVFDPLVAAQVAAQVTLDALLAPERMARIADQHRRDPAVPGPEQLAARLLSLASAPAASSRLTAVRQVVGRRIVLSLAKAARNPATGTLAAGALDQAVTDWASTQADRRFGDSGQRAWALSTARLLLDREALGEVLRDDAAEPKIPPGMPIGSEG